MYTFKLQTVLDHRQFLQACLEKELAETQARLLVESRHLQSLERKAMKTTAALKREQAEGLSSDAVVAYQTYLKRLSEQMIRHRDRLNEIRQTEARTKNDLIEAMKRSKILEKLKQQGLDRYNRAMIKKERDWIDEVAVNGYARQAAQSEEKRR